MNAQLSPAVSFYFCKNHQPLLCKQQTRWLLSRITYYLKKRCTPSDAIDFAMDDCLMEGIFYSLFMYRRAEVKERILQQFPPSFTYHLWYSSSGEIRLRPTTDNF